MYNSCSQQNPITWRAFRDRVVRNVRAHPFDHLMYYPFTFGIKNRYPPTVARSNCNIVQLSQWLDNRLLGNVS